MLTRHLLQSMRIVVSALAGILLFAGVVSAGPAQFVIVNINPPGVGFNDPSPATPVGGNTGTTLGQQRLIAFEHAAAIWSARLDSNVPIRIRAQFTPLAAGVLGSASPVSVSANFPNAPLANTWYQAAQLQARAATLQTFVGSHQVPTAASVWSGINTRLQGLASAYGTP
jgi:hypothetical protein